MRISDWSSTCALPIFKHASKNETAVETGPAHPGNVRVFVNVCQVRTISDQTGLIKVLLHKRFLQGGAFLSFMQIPVRMKGSPARNSIRGNSSRSEAHTSELQSLMRIPYAVFCLKKNSKR